MGSRQKKEYRGIRFLLSGFVICAVMVLALCIRFYIRMPDNVGKALTEPEKMEIISRNSPMIDYIYLSPNGDFPRTDTIKKLTIHHMAGNLALEDLGESFSQRDRRASANYAIDSNGRVALYVEESNRAWTSSSKENDSQAVTIEVANDEIGGDWHVSDEAYETLIDLCVDICQRNGIERLYFTGDEQGNLTIHKMFNNSTQCPGPYLEMRLGDIVQEVNERLENQ